MAANLQLLKRRIKTAHNIAQVARAMEMVAASKIKKAQGLVLANKPYTEKITTMSKNLLSHIQEKKITHPYVERNKSPSKLLILVSSDKGLCGSLVTNLSKRFLEETPKNLLIITIGKKMETLAAKLRYKLIASFRMGTTFPAYSVIYPIIEIIHEYYLKGQVGRVEILYTSFQSLFVQTPLMETLLPIEPLIQGEETSKNPDYIFEPNLSMLISELLPHYLEVKLYHAITQAYTSEQAARMIAMQNAKDNAKDVASYLTLEYNKSRQERITNELLDLANGQVGIAYG